MFKSAILNQKIDSNINEENVPEQQLARYLCDLLDKLLRDLSDLSEKKINEDIKNTIPVLISLVQTLKKRIEQSDFLLKEAESVASALSIVAKNNDKNIQKIFNLHLDDYQLKKELLEFEKLSKELRDVVDNKSISEIEQFLKGRKDLEEKTLKLQKLLLTLVKKIGFDKVIGLAKVFSNDTHKNSIVFGNIIPSIIVDDSESKTQTTTSAPRRGDSREAKNNHMLFSSMQRSDNNAIKADLKNDSYIGIERKCLMCTTAYGFKK